jgi:5-formyltetrahydrofolate cyclo-ligase
MNKTELRSIFLNKQKNRSFEERMYKSAAVCLYFFTNFDLFKVRTLHIFIPILKYNEIDTHLIINRLRTDYPHIRIVVPKTNWKALAMGSYEYLPDSPMQETKWGSLEPVAGTPIPPEEIDMVLIPGLAFDQKGFRVGYGMGFYDRFLVQCRKDVIKVGLSFEVPVQPIEDVGPYDVRLDYCVTPEKVWRFMPEGRTAY